MVVLDTNTLIYYFKGMGNVATKLLQFSPQEVSIPAIVLFELEVGIAKSTFPQKRREQLEALTAVIAVLPFAQKEASVAAQIRATLEQAGTSIGAYDVLIAATARSIGATLITHNVEEFSRVPQLQIEDWY